ncbi:MAG: hypothetical protein ABW133_02330, partial [Polyangiaceae bacterium]
MRRLFAYTCALFLAATVFLDCTRVVPATSTAFPFWTPMAPPYPVQPMMPNALAPSAAITPPGGEGLADPSADELAQVRLVPATCETNRHAFYDYVEDRIAEMRHAVDDAMSAWIQLPDCNPGRGLGFGSARVSLGLYGSGVGGGG